MPIGGAAALRPWADSENPSDSLWREVAEVVFRLGETPWLAPSTPLHGGSGEVWADREIPVPATGIRILYRHRHSDGLVDLHYIATELG